MSNGSFRELSKECRTYRRFNGDVPVSLETLKDLVDCARMAPSASNRQALRFLLVNDPGKCRDITDMLGWAGYLKEWPGPADKEQPTGYIIILCDTRITKDPSPDQGIAAHAILLGATDKGLGGCMFGSIKRKELHAYLGLDSVFDISLAVAVGKPAETVCIDDADPGDSLRYFRDESDTHHVPKLKLEHLIVK